MTTAGAHRLSSIAGRAGAIIAAALLCLQFARDCSDNTRGPAVPPLASPVGLLCHPAVSNPIRLADPADAAPRVMPPVNDSYYGFAWPDTPMGVVGAGDSLAFFASDGGRHGRQYWRGAWYGNDNYGSVTRSYGTLADPLGVGPAADSTIQPNPDPSVNIHLREYGYLGGGPVYQVPAGMVGAGGLLLVYHAEIGTPPGYYSLLGLAASTDGGASWLDLGEIIRPNYPNTGHLPAGYDIGDSRLVVSRDRAFFYIHFQDWLRGSGAFTQLSVARAPVAAVLQAAFGGTRHFASAFHKYYDGAWEQAGLGGLSADLNPNAAYSGGPQVAWSAGLRRYVLITDDSQHIAYAESPDGLRWSQTQLLGTFAKTPDVAAYAVPIGAGRDPNVLDRAFHVFFAYHQDRHDAAPLASLWRFTVSCR